MDYMNAYKIFQDEMEKGINGPLMDNMNAYNGENQLSSKVAELQERHLKIDVKKMQDQVDSIASEFGKGKEGGYQRQVGLILLMGQHSHMPVLFRVLPGNITDVTTVQDMLFRFDTITDDRRVFGAVVDRGYFSLANLARFIDAGSRVIMAAKTDAKWVRQAIEESMTHLWTNVARIPGDSCCPKSRPTDI